MSTDPLDDLLMPEFSPPPPFKAGLRDKTMRLIRRRRWRRRVLWAAAACLIFAAGMGAMAWMREASDAREAIAKAREAEERAATRAFLAAEKSMPGHLRPPVESKPTEKLAPDADKLPHPVALEWQAFDGKPGPEKSKLLLDAAQKYLREKNDVAAAVRCYAEALDNTDRRGREISEDDDFLVMALKLDQQKEK